MPRPARATRRSAIPGGLRARWRWAGSGQGAAVFALTEAGGTLEDLGPLVSRDFEQLCRAELRIDGPVGAWTVRLASAIHDEPAGLVWDDAGLFVVKYGFHTYGFESADGRAPLVAPLGVAADRGLRLAAARRTSSSSRRSRRSRSSPTGRSAGGSPTATSCPRRRWSAAGSC